MTTPRLPERLRAKITHERLGLCVPPPETDRDTNPSPDDPQPAESDEDGGHAG